MDDTASQPSAADAAPPVFDAPAPASTILAADVGGTNARVALAEIPRHGAPRILALRRYACAEYPSLAAILRDFRQVEGRAVNGATVAIAGVLDGDHLVNTNLPWPVSLQATRREAGLAWLELMNDFEAVAHAIAHVPMQALVALNGEQPRTPQWPALVLGPGTGLGAALRLADGAQPVLASEAGHSALAPGNALELEILGRLMQRWPHVDTERVLSGTGLMNLYPCLCEIRGASPRWTTPEQLVDAAMQGDDALAVETLEVFCGWLGSTCGDLAIDFGARSVYLAGGLAGHIEPFLQRGGFRERFLTKGVLGEVLAHVPVWRVEHGELGVLGAAAWHAWRQTTR
jgi:glucokinase